MLLEIRLKVDILCLQDKFALIMVVVVFNVAVVMRFSFQLFLKF